MATPEGIGVPFDEAIRFQRAKLGTLLPSRTWTDTYGRLNSVGFAVAGAWKDALLLDLGNAVVDLLESGRPARTFEQDLARIAAAHQWAFKGGLAWRARVIAETNLRGAYAAGKWQQIQATKAEFPFIRYVAVLDDRTRRQHRAWHGTILRVDDPWWNTHYPPNGWGCRCTVQQVNARDLVRRGWVVQPEAPALALRATPVDPRRSLQTKMVPRGIDPGFEHNAGKVLEEPFMPQLVDDLRQGFVGPIARKAASEAKAVGATAAADQARADAGRALDNAMLAYQAVPPPMPPPRAFDPARLLPEDVTEPAAVRAFLSRFGGAADRAVIVQPPGGGALAVGPDMFRTPAGVTKLPKDARKPFLPMIADALADPDEVWAALEWNEAEQRVIVRRRYIARFDVAGRREVAIAVFEWTGAYWRAVTAFAPRGGQAKAARKDEYLARQGRAGVRIYARPEDVAEERPGGGGPAGRPGG